MGTSGQLVESRELAAYLFGALAGRTVGPLVLTPHARLTRASCSPRQWHHNVFLLRHLSLLALQVLVYIYPTTSDPGASGSLQIATALGITRDALTRATSNVALAQAGRDAIWQDSALRSRAVDYYATHDSDVGDEVLVEAARRGVIKPDARKRASGLVLTKVEELARSVVARDAPEE